MTRRTLASPRSGSISTLAAAWAAAVLLPAFGSAALAAADLPVTEQQRSTARQAAEAGVPLAELAPNAPDTYTVRRGDTLWGISGLYLTRPWRWPELWGMNLQEIRNPHLIYPGQALYLDKTDGRARLRTGPQPAAGGAADWVKLSPRVRPSPLDAGAIASIPFNLIEPFLTEAVIFEDDSLNRAPRIVATQEGRVLLSRGDTAYVRGELGADTVFRIFRAATPLRDPSTGEILGYEAPYVGAAEYLREGEEVSGADGRPEIVPATFVVTTIRQEANVGDRLAPVAAQEFVNYAPHAPQGRMAGQIVSIHGDALTAGQNQIVALNRGARDGVERGHVLALVRDGSRVVDDTDLRRVNLKLPDERHGMLFVFRVFNRMSYALILSVKEPVKPGDKFTQP